MSVNAPPPNLLGRVLTMRIITGAIILGAVTSFVILTLVRGQNPAPRPFPEPVISYIALAVAAVQGLAAVIVPSLMVAAGRRRLASLAGAADPSIDAAAWYNLYQSQLIVRLAMLEGATLFLIMAWFLEGWSVPRYVAGAFIAVMLLQFPNALRVERWVEAQRESAYQDRALS